MIKSKKNNPMNCVTVQEWQTFQPVIDDFLKTNLDLCNHQTHSSSHPEGDLGGKGSSVVDDGVTIVTVPTVEFYTPTSGQQDLRSEVSEVKWGE